MESPTVAEVFPQLLEAALDDEPVERLRELVQERPSLANGRLTSAHHSDWTTAARDCSPHELAALIRLLTLAETAAPSWRHGGSVDPVIWLFQMYRRCASPSDARALYDWVLRHTLNGWAPTGSDNSGATSLEDLRERRRAHTDAKLARAAAETKRHEDAKTRRSGKATWDIFGAIRRGDTPAVRALLEREPYLTARNADEVTPLEYAEQLGKDAVVEVLRKRQDE